MKDTLGALADRCAALKIDAGVLHVSRLLHSDSRGLAVKRITMYSPNWVRSQNRMSSTSNQASTASAHLPCVCSQVPHLWDKPWGKHTGFTPGRCCGLLAQFSDLWLHDHDATHELHTSCTLAALDSGKWLCMWAAQETFRVENVEGRVVLDILRHVLTACNLSSFSLVDCCQSLLGRRLEVPAGLCSHLPLQGHRWQ